jgi:hypothetical protein
MTPTQAELKELLNYNPETGVFTWKVDKSRTAKTGRIAGRIHYRGYVIICVNGKPYPAHRLAWFYTYGSWPINNIDHLDGNPGYNAIANLRDVTQRENSQNKQAHRNGKLVGASYNRVSGKWVAQAFVMKNTRKRHIGCFDTELEAHEAYLKAIADTE